MAVRALAAEPTRYNIIHCELINGEMRMEGVIAENALYCTLSRKARRTSELHKRRFQHGVRLKRLNKALLVA
jgi:hypothetical protein